MHDPEPARARPLTEDGSLMPWNEALDALATPRFYWLATVNPAGAPHIRPVLAVWCDGAMYTTTGPATRKGRNLAAEGRVSLTARTDDLDVILEGRATRVVDPDILERVRATYLAKYGWPATVRDAAFDAPYGAPTAGRPPYHVFEILPATLYALGTDDTTAPRSTRFDW
jgi:nitroimidazol reductase NimA-like FMN-containing flavoprotein (pyridoxamine 5'-phosphate oxidase superfamily)